MILLQPLLRLFTARLLRISLILWSILLVSPAWACKLTVRFELYPPQAYLDENNQWQGMDVDFAKVLLNEAGCQYTFVKVPWGRAMGMLEKGELDMMLSVSRNPERQKFAHFIGPQREESIVLISKASDPITEEKFNNLKTWDKPIAIQQGAYYGEKFAKMRANDTQAHAHFIIIPNNDIKLSLLHKGRVSGIIDEKLNILYQIQQNPEFSNIVVYPLVIHVNKVYYAFSRASVDATTIARLQKAFDTLQHNNRLLPIERRYDPVE